MDVPVAVVSGALFGLLGCAAPAALFERALRGDAPVSLAAGIAAVGAVLCAAGVAAFARKRMGLM